MKILIVNDDGYRAAGIAALARALQNEHEVFVCAPKENQSAVGHGLTLRRLLRVQRVELEGCNKVEAYCVDGLPADCTRIALGNLGIMPDLVLSGINQAPNLGTDVLYSGTVAGASEAAMLGFRSIAVSRDMFNEDYFDDVAEVFKEILPLIMQCFTQDHRLLNVNFPCIPRSEYRGIRTGYLVEQVYPLEFAEIKDSYGEILYQARSTKLTECGEDEKSDEKFVRDGYITMTPLKYDITDYNHLKNIEKFVERDFV